MVPPGSAAALSWRDSALPTSSAMRTSSTMKKKYQSAHTVSVALAATCVCLIGSAFAADDAAKSSDAPVLRICAAAKEAPYSSRDQKGFENRIAEVIAGAMDRKVEFVWSDKPAIYLVRDQLEPGNCDVVMGVDTGDERLLTTKAYYRAPYVFVERSDSPLDITSFDSPDLMKTGKIAFEAGTPAEVMITKLGLYNRNFNYMKSLTNFKSPRNQYVRVDPDRMVGDVANGTADLAIAFAPEVARYVKDSERQAEDGRHSGQQHADRRREGAVPFRPVDRRAQEPTPSCSARSTRPSKRRSRRSRRSSRTRASL